MIDTCRGVLVCVNVCLGVRVGVLSVACVCACILGAYVYAFVLTCMQVHVNFNDSLQRASSAILCNRTLDIIDALPPVPSLRITHPSHACAYICACECVCVSL